MEQVKGNFYLLCAFILAGTGVIAARYVSGRLGPFTITAVSMFFALIILLPLCFNRLGRTIRTMSPGDFGMLLLQALCGIFLFRLFLLTGLMHTSSGEAGVLTGATPAITFILALIALKEPANKKNTAGIFSTVSGILLINGFLTPDAGITMKHLMGNLLVLCAAVCESMFNIFSRAAAVKKFSGSGNPADPVMQAAVVSAAALFLCLIPSLREHPVPALAALALKEWLALFWYGAFVTALAFIFWYAGIKRRNAFTAAAFSGMMPFTALVLSVVVLGEQAGWRLWLGGMLVILGMVLIGSGSPDNEL